jgi:ribosome-binding factor A
MSARNRRGRKQSGSRGSFESTEFGDAIDTGDAIEMDADADDLFGERRSRRRGVTFKDQQLCEQVFQILSVAMADLGDEVLRQLSIETVEMGPDASRLSVAVLMPPGQAVPWDDVMDRLGRVRGVLRSEIASGIHRKRTPELSFRVVMPEPAEEVER